MIGWFKRLFKRRKVSIFEKRIGYEFRNQSYLEQALTHPSYLSGNNGYKNSSYERFEFLGDALLGFIVSDYLFKKYPQFNEGELTERRRILVSGKALSQIALKLRLQDYILFSHKDSYELVEDHQAILADAYEALIGAIYLDGGIESVIRFLERFHFVEEINLLESRDFVNFKGKLLEFLQSQGFSPPKYKLERVLGPDHRKYYLISAWSEGKFLGLGGGFSRKEAEQQAAERALKILLKEEK